MSKWFSKRAWKPALTATLAAVMLFGRRQGRRRIAIGPEWGGNQELTQVKVKSHMGVGTIPGADNPHVQYVAERTGVEYQLVTTRRARSRLNISI